MLDVIDISVFLKDEYVWDLNVQSVEELWYFLLSYA